MGVAHRIGKSLCVFEAFDVEHDRVHSRVVGDGVDTIGEVDNGLISHADQVADGQGAIAGYHVGDNEPYSGKMPEDYTIDNHAEPTNLPHVGLEIRQDLILHDEGVARIADVLHDLLSSAPARLQPTNLDSWRSG